MSHRRYYYSLLIACIGLWGAYALPIYAQTLAGIYTGTYAGQSVKLVLSGQDNTLTGVLSDEQSTVDIAAFGQGNYWAGTATERQTAAQALIAGELKGNQLEIALTMDITNVIEVVLQRGTNPPANNSTPAAYQAPSTSNMPTAKGGVEPQLVGSWIKSVSNSSGYGSDMAYFQTDVLFRINADATFEYGATRSVGGGGNWSYDGSAWSAPQMTGLLRSDGKHIYIVQANGQTIAAAQQDMGTYFIDGNRMATTAKDGTKDYWQR